MTMALWMGIALTVGLVAAGASGTSTKGKAAGGKPVVTQGIHAFRVTTIDGDVKPLSEYRGNALLIVNTASRCGFTSQYESLETLYGKYKDRGFEVLAFPANNFMNQEPGTNEQIKEFCRLKFGTTLPLVEKISVKGKDIAPLYAYLTRESPFAGEIPWNFTKFLIAPDGRVVARFDPKVDPLAKVVTDKLEGVLPRGRSSRL